MIRIGIMGREAGRGFLAVLVAAAALLAAATAAEAQAPPAPWVDTHVNNNATGPAGVSTYNAGTFTVDGSGADIWTIDSTPTGTPTPIDEFQFVHQTYSGGDFQIVARVTSLAIAPGSTTLDAWAKAGVMARQTAVATDPNPPDLAAKGAVFAAVLVTPTNGVNLQWRNTAGGWCGNTQGIIVAAPIYVRLVRRGGTFFGYYSANGTTWFFLGASDVTINSPMEVGLAVTSHNDTQMARATFTNVTNPGAIQSPPTPSVPPATPTAVGDGTGLNASYYVAGGSAPVIPATAQYTTTEAPINFDWGNGAVPGWTGGPADGFAVRWSGSIEPRYTGRYTFYTRTDDGVRLLIDGSAIIDHWVDQGPTWYGSSVILQAGWQYNITMEYYENGGGALAQLFWESDNAQAWEAIPGTQLFTFTSPAGGQAGPRAPGVPPPPPPGGGGGGSEGANGDNGINDWCWGSSSVPVSPAPLAVLGGMIGLVSLIRRRRK